MRASPRLGCVASELLDYLRRLLLTSRGSGARSVGLAASHAIRTGSAHAWVRHGHRGRAVRLCQPAAVLAVVPHYENLPCQEIPTRRRCPGGAAKDPWATSATPGFTMCVCRCVLGVSASTLSQHVIVSTAVRGTRRPTRAAHTGAWPVRVVCHATSPTDRAREPDEAS